MNFWAENEEIYFLQLVSLNLRLIAVCTTSSCSLRGKVRHDFIDFFDVMHFDIFLIRLVSPVFELSITIG